TLPLLISVPHGGPKIPPEVESICVLTQEQIVEDGDEGAGEIYSIEDEVAAFVTTGVARAFVDVNRAEDDRRADGVVKTHTIWEIPIYS
ncbi:MAG: N-formylglutamate amidohydrolase, partial [Anaerolineae bacterium]|nr:N-formylglutamate amidohydrolase [Anaerolineae bacterium]